MDINRIVSRLQTFFDTDNITIPDPKIENRMDNIVQKTTSSDTITGSKDYSIANLLRALGIKHPENQALILLIPLYGLPIMKRVLNLFWERDIELLCFMNIL